MKSQDFLRPPANGPADKRRLVDQQRGHNHFHDSALEDVYDLYKACNGVISGGLLDVRKLDELMAGEREALDVERLLISPSSGTKMVVLNGGRCRLRRYGVSFVGASGRVPPAFTVWNSVRL